MLLTETKEPLKILYPLAEPRITSEYRAAPEAFYYLEIGWTETTLNPFHIIPGEVIGEGPWQIGDVTIRVLTPEDPEYQHYQGWVELKGTTNITDERSKEALDWSISMATEDLTKERRENMLLEPQCSIRNCAHYEGVKYLVEDEEESEVNYCSAFPDGIPEEIAYGENKHTELFPDQVGTIVYEPA